MNEPMCAREPRADSINAAINYLYDVKAQLTELRQRISDGIIPKQENSDNRPDVTIASVTLLSILNDSPGRIRDIANDISGEIKDIEGMLF